MRVGGERAAMQREIVLQVFAERCLAEGAGQHRDDRDADLHGGEQARRVGLQFECRLGAGAALGGARLQPRRPGRDEGDLGHREKAVHQDQQQQNRKMQGQHGSPPFARHSRGRGNPGEWAPTFALDPRFRGGDEWKN